MAEEAKRRRTNEGKSPIEIQFIQDGPAVGWAVKGVGYNSGTRYFVKRADSTEWTRRSPTERGETGRLTSQVEAVSENGKEGK
eukprot:s470_g21.t1